MAKRGYHGSQMPASEVEVDEGNPGRRGNNIATDEENKGRSSPVIKMLQSLLAQIVRPCT